MLKSQELSNSKSCLHKAESDEMLFVLLGRDAAAPDTMRFWVKRRIELGKNKITDPQVMEALNYAAYMETGRVINGGKVK